MFLTIVAVFVALVYGFSKNPGDSDRQENAGIIRIENEPIFGGLDEILPNDPENRIVEKNENNNSATSYIEIVHNTVKIISAP